MSAMHYSYSMQREIEVSLNQHECDFYRIRGNISAISSNPGLPSIAHAFSVQIRELNNLISRIAQTQFKVNQNRRALPNFAALNGRISQLKQLAYYLRNMQVVISQPK